LIRLIRHRFGEISSGLMQKITQADSNSLLLWSDKVLGAGSVEEIFAEESLL